MLGKASDPWPCSAVLLLAPACCRRLAISIRYTWNGHSKGSHALVIMHERVLGWIQANHPDPKFGCILVHVGTQIRNIRLIFGDCAREDLPLYSVNYTIRARHNLAKA